MLSLYAIKMEHHPDGIWRIKTEVGGHYVGQVWPEEAAISEGVDAEAMARLLAAAPDLLAALEVAQPYVESTWANYGGERFERELALVNAAIAKAKEE